MNKHRSEGFTLIEILIALALITGISLMTFSALAPYLSFRQQIETERRLGQLQETLKLLYRTNAMTVENNGGQQLEVTVGSTSHTIQSNTPGANGLCTLNDTAAAALTFYLPEDPKRALTDGFSNPFCLYISNRLSQNREGVTLYYHVIALVSGGKNGRIDAGTSFDVGAGRLSMSPDSDDISAILNGFAVQYDLFRETKRRVDRVAEIYGTYFTSRYLSNPERDYIVDYFVAGQRPYDASAPGGPVGTGGQWLPVSSALANLGLGPEEQTSPYEANNNIEVANQMLASALVVNGVQVQEPNSKPIPVPPYTALLRTRLPGPSGNYLLKVVPGNY